ncbi:hypothetical protein [Vibrio agarivorans]|uniref:Uncharacterized protein n=1 Tax=Vibrio agarivorans TaxID=153622 RepID=A0ABT7Y734_9VIBR|nr:hypothetical protein [Vibrio agarivorans]MDN2483865.1 hypothetical protein [Vibrio agarivorans]
MDKYVLLLLIAIASAFAGWFLAFGVIDPDSSLLRAGLLVGVSMFTYGLLILLVRKLGLIKVAGLDAMESVEDA